MASLMLGPVLRHVTRETATVWVETDRACTVEVLGHREPTFCVAGHHYALVCVRGLQPDTSTPYEVLLDGEPVWPAPDSAFPPSRIRTYHPARPVRISFGSCRYATEAASGADEGGYGGDALDALARALRGRPEAQWPDLLMMLGDQVYADETTEATQARIAARRGLAKPPHGQVADFEEYTWLYHESWSDPEVRWLLSTVPSAMIFDDHDVHDDWNTSRSWRQDIQATSWWAERITGGLMSYWIYQHLGNLAPGWWSSTRAAAGYWTAPGRCSRSPSRSGSWPGWTATTTTCCWAPRCRGCCRRRCTRWRPGTSGCASTRRGGGRGWASGCGAARTWSTGRRSTPRSGGWPGSWPTWAGAPQAVSRRPRSAYCPATCTTPTCARRPSTIRCAPGCTSSPAHRCTTRCRGTCGWRSGCPGAGWPSRPPGWCSAGWPGCRSRRCPGVGWPARCSATRWAAWCWTAAGRGCWWRPPRAYPPATRCAG